MAEATKPKKKAVTRTDLEKSKAFQELATARVNKALKAIKQIKYLTNTSTYIYTPQEVSAILNTINGALQELAASFKDPKAAKSEGFKLG